MKYLILASLLVSFQAYAIDYSYVVGIPSGSVSAVKARAEMHKSRNKSVLFECAEQKLNERTATFKNTGSTKRYVIGSLKGEVSYWDAEMAAMNGKTMFKCKRVIARTDKKGFETY